MQATTQIPQAGVPVAPAEPGQATPAVRVRRVLGVTGLVGVVAAAFGLAAYAAARPTTYVPASIRGGFPGWLAGPLHGLALGRLSDDRFQILVLGMCAAYALVLAAGRALGLRAVMVAVVAAHVAFLLGPVLLSQDVFGYLSFARLGALHGLDPYTHTSASVPTDAAFRYLGWRTVVSPYGPLFTLGSYLLTPLGVPAGLWALKTIAAATSLATVALVARAAQALDRSPAAAAAFVGLNPVLLVYALGGAHNDTLLIALLAAAVMFATGARWGRAASSLAVAVGVKISAGLVLAFLVLGPRRGERLRVLAVAGVGLVAVAIIALAGFGPHALGFAGALRGEQQMVATHSVPNETASLVGLPSLHVLPAWWRDLFLAAFAVATLACLVQTARGADWRAAAAWATLALLLSTAWLLPWYAIWLLPLAAVVEDRRLRAAVLAMCVYAVLIRLPLAAPLLGGRRS